MKKRVLAQALAAIPWQVVDEVLVIDGGSTDHTPDIAQRAGARVISLNQGVDTARHVRPGLRKREEIFWSHACDGADDPRLYPRNSCTRARRSGTDMVSGSAACGQMEEEALAPAFGELAFCRANFYCIWLPP